MSHPTDSPVRQSARVERLVEGWALKYGERIIGYFRHPAQAALWSAFPPTLSEGLREALAQRGIERPYSHQRKVWDHARAGAHVVVVTPTASGKTLYYSGDRLELTNALRTR